MRVSLATQFTEDRETHAPVKIEHHRAVLAAVEAGRAEVLQLHAAGEIHDRVLRMLEWELDLQQLVAESHDE